MQSSAVLDETSSLADSAYELISSTDGESQDGRHTDSLADSIAGSFDLYPRADDVHSLNGQEAAYDDYEDDDEDDEDGDNQDGSDDEYPGKHNRHSGRFAAPNPSQLYSATRGTVDGSNEVRRSSQVDSIRYAEQSLCNPSTQSLSTLDYDSSHGDISGGHSPLVHSIEFSEDDDVKVHLEKISVKHTIREFTEGESSIIAANMGIMADAPKRLAATIRQTMSHLCLSTHEPLRVLYVGSDAAYNDIMYKISSALLASAPTAGTSRHSSGHRHASTPGIYNIMPISSFGSAKVPEIDEIQLMGVSDYYIKVERCVRAEEIVYEGKAFPNDTVYSIELDSGASHVSVFHPSGSTVNPSWALPHFAVFYVSGNDDKQTEATRSAAWEFMTRHAVPSIFISHTQTFSRSSSAGRWQYFVDQAAVHLCLESRDLSKPTAPERLPIDLVSFLNIDARQMNRNLAYLTGLQDDPKKEKKSSRIARARGTASIGGILLGLAQTVHLVRQGRDPRTQVVQTASDFFALLKGHVLGLLSTAFITAIISLLLYSPLLSSTSLQFSQQRVTSSAAVQLASSTTTSVPLIKSESSPPTPVSSPICSVPTVAPTVTISFVTTTKTVEIRVPVPTSSQTPAPFGGLLTDKAHNQKTAKLVSDTEIKSTGCSIQVHSSHEILVKVPSWTKTKWLAKGAIDIDVWQGQKVLKSKLSATDDGIIIEIDRKDAYGVMNVSIVTTLRPKINETFAVDFGKRTAGRLLEEGLSLWYASVQQAASTGVEVASWARSVISTYADEHTMLPLSAQSVINNATVFIGSATSGLQSFREDLIKGYQRFRGSDVVGDVVQGAQSLVEDWAPVQSKIRDEVRLSVLRAQIASKLWWLRVQGKIEEHDAYEAKATKHILDMELAAERKGAHGRKDTAKKPVPKASRIASGRLAAWLR